MSLPKPDFLNITVGQERPSPPPAPRKKRPTPLTIPTVRYLDPLYETTEDLEIRVRRFRN